MTIAPMIGPTHSRNQCRNDLGEPGSGSWLIAG